MKKNKVLLLTLASLAVSPAVTAFEKGDLIVRGGFSVVSPDESSSNIEVGGSDLGVGIAVDDNTQISVTLAYFLTDNLNIEVLAATPFKHDVNFGVSDPLGTGDQLGEVTHLPPTVSLNYYFNGPDSKLQPYVGVGLNYTVFFEEKFTAANRDIGLQDLSLDNSFGLAAQVGVDYLLNDGWFINGSVRWVDIDTEASFNLSGTVGVVSDIEIDPFVYTLSVGYKF